MSPRVGTIGFCMGGTFMLNLAAERDDLATVCYYGFPSPPRLGGNPGPAPLEQVPSLRGSIVGFWGSDEEGVGHGFLARALTDSQHPGHRHASDSCRRTLAFYRRQLG